MVFRILLILFLPIALSSCNSGKTDEEMEELWSKAQTTGKIIERSGTKFNSGTNKELALRDAQNRLMSGGGLFKDGLTVDGILNRNNSQNNSNVNMIGMSITLERCA